MNTTQHNSLDKSISPLEANGIKPACVVRTGLYSDLAYNACLAYAISNSYNKYALQVGDTCVIRLPDGEIAFAAKHKDCWMSASVDGTNCKYWRTHTAYKIIMFVKRCMVQSHISYHDIDLRKYDAEITYETYNSMTHKSESHMFNVAAAMYVYDKLLDHGARSFNKYDAEFNIRCAGKSYDPMLSEAIGVIKEHVTELAKQKQEALKAIESEFYHKECDTVEKLHVERNLALEKCEAEWQQKINEVLQQADVVV